MDMSCGCLISREVVFLYVVVVEVFRGFFRLVNIFNEEWNLDFKLIIKMIIILNKFYNVFNNFKLYFDIVNMNKLFNDSIVVIKFLKSNLLIFNSMDCLVYYNVEKDFGFVFLLYFKCIFNYEGMNDENICGWYIGDGMFYFYNSD